MSKTAYFSGYEASPEIKLVAKFSWCLKNIIKTAVVISFQIGPISKISKLVERNKSIDLPSIKFNLIQPRMALLSVKNKKVFVSGRWPNLFSNLSNCKNVWSYLLALLFHWSLHYACLSNTDLKTYWKSCFFIKIII